MLAVAPFGFHTPLPVIVLGAIIGTTYGLLGVGLVLVYRTNRIINFAQGEIGAFGAALFGMIVLRWHVPYYAALPIAFIASAYVAALAEVAVVRRLRNAPRIMSVVATLGIGQFLVFLSKAVIPDFEAARLFPSPPGLPTFMFGALRLTQAYVGMLIFGPVAVLALALFLRRSRLGIALRCAAANQEAARMAGIFADNMSTVAWAIAGALSALTAILVLPSSGFASGESFGPSLLLRAMTAAVVARMRSLPAALAAGIGLGIVEQLLYWNYPRAGFVDVALFVVILAALLVQRGVGGRDDESKGSWASVQGWRPLPAAVADLREVRALPWVLGGVSLAVALALPALVTNGSATTLTTIMAFSIVGLSIAIVTGLGGQLSLGQFAVAAVGAVISYQVSRRTAVFPLAFLYAGLGGAGVALLLGIPALRIRGLLLTVCTLGFAVVTSGWLLQQPWAFGGGVDPGRPAVFGHALETGKAYYYLVLTILVLVMLLVRNVRRGGFGRLLVAVRDNEDNARAFTVSARTVKLQGFLVAGFVAGLGGAAYGHLLTRLGAAAFPESASIDVAVMAVLGGMSLLAGPIIGSLYIIGLPAFVPLDSAGFAAQKLGWLLLLLYLPGGIGQGLEPIRERFVKRVARRHGIDLATADVVPSSGEERTLLPAPTTAAAAHRRVPAGSPLLEGVELRKRFGGVDAVDGVSISVRTGEIVGLIGPNGAGKTTTFEVLGGFTRPDHGRVIFDGEDVSGQGPEQRARRGLVRSFQDASLFPTMTVLDVARLAFERVAPTSFFSSVAGLQGSERAKARMATDLVDSMGLGAYRHKQIQELSTGTRRITEIACLIALRPTLVLLDEPSSGIAQRETEALGGLLREIRDSLGLTMLIIEHDIPLIMGLSDRVVAMDAGRVIAEGLPEAVRNDPAVVEAYLGGRIEAIERSGTAAHDVEEPDVEGLTAVPGVGPKLAASLLSVFGSVDAIRTASTDELAAVPGVGPRLAGRLQDSLP